MGKKFRLIRVVEIEELNKMHTGSLLSRLQALRECNETVNWGEESEGREGLIVSKDSCEWKKALSGRGHYAKKTRRMK